MLGTKYAVSVATKLSAVKDRIISDVFRITVVTI